MIEKISLTVEEIQTRPDFDDLMRRVAEGSLEVEVVESGTGKRRAVLVASTTIAMIEHVINKL